MSKIVIEELTKIFVHRYPVEAGVGLYDSYNNRVGWVVGKRVWPLLKKSNGQPYLFEHNDWDIEWSNGVKAYLSESSLQVYIYEFIKRQDSND
jgi:hypothetical protein